MNIREVASLLNISYSTMYKYVINLEKHGLITVKLDKHSKEISSHDFEVVKAFVELIKQGMSFSQALSMLSRSYEDQKEPQDVMEKLQELSREIKDLKKENENLRELIQVYLSRIDNLEKALTPPKRSWLSKLFHCKK
jgi:uncharacterized coiled-coil DUF342 family protein